MKKSRKLLSIMMVLSIICLNFVPLIGINASENDGFINHNIAKKALVIDEAQGDYVVTGNTYRNRIIVKSGEHTIKLKNTYIDISDESKMNTIWIGQNASVTLILEGKNVLEGTNYYPAIVVYGALTISEDSSGKLDINSGVNAYGIMASEGSTVEINGGTINIKGGNNASGILANESSLQINGGNINVYAGNNESAISAPYGEILISGGNITAQGRNTGAGITSTDGLIAITGGNVHSVGGSGGAGIGGCAGETGDDIIIRGGTIYATGGSGAAGIGGGEGEHGGNIEIQEATVTAIGGARAAGIGGGDKGSGIQIVITGAKVTAKGGTGQNAMEDDVGGAGIGGGYVGNSGTIIIQDLKKSTGEEVLSSVVATGGKDAADIGAGCYGDGQDIRLIGTDIRSRITATKIGGVDGHEQGTVTVNGAVQGTESSDNNSGVAGSVFGDADYYFGVTLLVTLLICGAVIAIFIKNKSKNLN